MFLTQTQQREKEATDQANQLVIDRAKWRSDLSQYDEHYEAVAQFNSKIQLAHDELAEIINTIQHRIVLINDQKHLAENGVSDALRGRIKLLETAPDELRAKLKQRRDELRKTSTDEYGSQLLPLLERRLEVAIRTSGDGSEKVNSLRRQIIDTTESISEMTKEIVELETECMEAD